MTTTTNNKETTMQTETRTVGSVCYRQVTLNDIQEISETIYEVIASGSKWRWFTSKPLDTDKFLRNLDYFLWECHQMYLGESNNTATIKAILKIARKAKRELA